MGELRCCRSLFVRNRTYVQGMRACIFLLAFANLCIIGPISCIKLRISFVGRGLCQL